MAKRLLKVGADWNAEDKYKQTPLIKMLHNPSLWSLLCEHVTLKMDEVNTLGNDALYFALESASDLLIVERLLNTGRIEVNARNGQGVSILEYAVEFNRVDFIHCLLEHGQVEINAKNGRGCSALMQASKADNRLPIIELLLSYEPNVDARSEEEGFSALDIAVEYSAWSNVKILIAHSEPATCLSTFNYAISQAKDTEFEGYLQAVGRKKIEEILDLAKKEECLELIIRLQRILAAINSQMN